MRIILWLFLAILLATRAGAQSNAPVRLALIAETEDASIACDLLTVELSKNPQVKLLERNEIERVYREQGLSAANQDYLKLGQVLGADGVLLVGTVTNTNPGLRIQLIAVKPGVLLASERFSPPVNLSQWASGLAMRLTPLLPKLSVLAQDAMPISVVNFRSAIQSPETKEMERELTGLAIERLSRERQLIVLERTKMQMLAAEKELKGLGDSAFWNGSYLLDGTLDRDGYSPDKITISARLVPPNGGVPLPIEVSGSRTNFPAVINQLAERVRESLKLANTAAPWNPADEAQKYFEEATWALKWGLNEQAQNASDSAWALGKQDYDCAVVHITAYADAIPKVDPVQTRSIYLRDRNSHLEVETIPSSQELDCALHALGLYDEFSRRLPPGEPKDNSPYYLLGVDTLEKATGVLRHFHYHPESQEAASEKLSDLRALARMVAAWISKSPSVRNSYALNGELPDADKLARDFNNRSDLNYGGQRNFFHCELQWGCLWQDRPEDCVALYRSLMTNSLFVRINKDLWFRDESNPRLTAWNSEDRKQLPEIWQNFMTEMDGSSDAFIQMEAKAIHFADAKTERDDFDAPPILSWINWPAYEALVNLNTEQDQKIETTFNDLFTFIMANFDKIINGRAELAYLDWDLGTLVGQGVVQTETTGKINNEYRNKYAPQIGKLRGDYVAQATKRRSDAVALTKQQVKEKADAEVLSAQKQYLTNFTPFEIHSFSKVFPTSVYSKEHAAELKPFFDAYCSNVIAHASPATKLRDDQELGAITLFLGHALDRALQSQTVRAVPTAAPNPSTNPSGTPAVSVNLPVKNNVGAASLEPLTNVIVARDFLHFPAEQFPTNAGLIVLSHRLCDGQLFLDVRYRDSVWQQDADGNNHQVVTTREGALLWNPASRWQVIQYPHAEGGPMIGGDLFSGAVLGSAQAPTLFVEILDDALYVSDRDAIRKFDMNGRHWTELPLRGQNRAQLFAVNNHLYAASPETIWEILDGGQGSRILASVRRRPAASILDSRDTLDRPVLFPGNGNSLYAALNGEVFSWNGNDWKSVLTIAQSDVPEIFQTTAFFRRSADKELEFWRLDPDQSKPVLCWREQGRNSGAPMSFGGSPGMSRPLIHAAEPVAIDRSISPLWKCPFGFSIGRAPTAMDESTLYFFIDRSDFLNPGTSSAKPIERRGRHAELVCLKSGFPEPVIVPIKFNSDGALVPVRTSNLGSSAWMECSSEFLFIGKAGLPGVWSLPKAEIQAEIQRQIRERRLEIENGQKSLFAKYDLNHNGVFDAEERESAINDPAFLNFEIDIIDSNNDGLLEPEELGYFDANHDGTLDPAEEAGIHTAEGILAARLLKGFDHNENGKLDGNEIREFIWKNYSGTFQNGDADVQKVQQFLDGTLIDLLSGQTLTRGPNPVGSASYPASFPLPWKTSFKQKVESYWVRQKSASPAKPQGVEN